MKLISCDTHAKHFSVQTAFIGADVQSVSYLAVRRSGTGRDKTALLRSHGRQGHGALAFPWKHFSDSLLGLYK